MSQAGTVMQAQKMVEQLREQAALDRTKVSDSSREYVEDCVCVCVRVCVCALCVCDTVGESAWDNFLPGSVLKIVTGQLLYRNTFLMPFRHSLEGCY